MLLESQAHLTAHFVVLWRILLWLGWLAIRYDKRDSSSTSHAAALDMHASMYRPACGKAIVTLEEPTSFASCGFSTGGRAVLPSAPRTRDALRKVAYPSWLFGLLTSGPYEIYDVLMPRVVLCGFSAGCGDVACGLR